MSEDSVSFGPAGEASPASASSPPPATPPAPATPQQTTAPLTPTSEHSATASSSSIQNAPQRPRPSQTQLESMSSQEIVQSWKELESYTDWMELQSGNQEAEIAALRAYLDRSKQQHIEACNRERAVLRRLATKEQEIQEYVAQISELKSNLTPNATTIRSALLDPAVNLLVQKLRGELVQTRTQLEETQNELSAWKFTPDSNTGKRLMAKCRLLYQENEELGRVVSSGRMAKLEGELALQKSFSQEVKKSQSELDEFLQELDEDVEGMQSTIYYLQQELRKSREHNTNLEHDIRKLRKLNGSSGTKTGTADEEVDDEEDEEEAMEENGDEEEHIKDWTEGEEEFQESNRTHNWANSNSEVNVINNGNDDENSRTKRANVSDESEESSELPVHKKARTKHYNDETKVETSLTNGTNDENAKVELNV